MSLRQTKKQEIMTLEIYTELRNEIEPRWNSASDLVQSFVNPTTGMVKDIKCEDYRAAKKSYDRVFNEVRTLNGNTSNKIKRDYSISKRSY